MRSLLFSCRLLGVAFVIAVAGRFALAQGDGTLLAEVSHKTDYDKQHFRFMSLRDKGSQAFGKDDLALMDLAAKYYVYRVTSQEAKQDPKVMHKVVSDFENQMDSAMRAAKTNTNPEFLKHFPKAAIARIKDVLELDFNANRLPCLNAAILLPSLAQTKQDYVAEYLVQLLNDPKKNEVIKLYAAKALREYPAARVYTDEDPPTDKALLAQKARDSARVEALLKMLDHKWPASEKSPKEEVDAVRFIRREVVAALASAQVPATATLIKKKPALEGPVAYGLIRILAKDGVTPSPSLAERCDAAIGLCYIKPPNLQYTKQEYQPQLAIFLVGKFLGDYISEYQKDFVNLKVKRLPFHPWKLNSERLAQALDELKANLKYSSLDAAYQGRFQKLYDEAKDVLGKIKSVQAVEAARPLDPLVNALTPKGDEVIVFRSFKKEQPKFELP